jgi:hypothetical protein
MYCGKMYKTTRNLNKHVILCEILYKSKNNKNYKKDEEDEEEIIPSNKYMYNILMDLTLKYYKLEEKVNFMHQIVVKKTKKINIIEYLNNHIKPAQNFEDFIHNIKITDSDIEYMYNNSILDTINEILKIHLKDGEDLPLMSFTQKQQMLYCYVKNGTEVTKTTKTNETIKTTKTNETNETNETTKTIKTTHKWEILTKELLIPLLTNIHIKLSKGLYEWKKKNMHIINNDAQCILYDKTFSKLMSIEYKHDSVIKQIINMIYSKTKKEIREIIELEF